MLPLNLVLDTNVVVSGVLKPAGLERASLVFALTAPARLYVSRDILEEYARVLHRPQRVAQTCVFCRSAAFKDSRREKPQTSKSTKSALPARLGELLDLLESRAVLVTPSRRLQVTPDPG
jgi:hypothetical protein